MDNFQFMSSLVESIAWPLSIGIVAIIFRKPLHDLLPRIKNLKLLGGEATFSEQLKKAEKSGMEMQSHSDTQKTKIRIAGMTLELPKKTNDPFFELAQNYPEAAVMDSFKMVEAVLADSRDDMDLPLRTNSRAIVQKLIDEGFLPYSAAEFFVTIVGTRNAAVHSTGKIITTGEAIAFRELCFQMAALIKEASQKRQKAKREQLNPKSAKKKLTIKDS